MRNWAVCIVRFLPRGLFTLAALAATGTAIAQTVDGGYRVFRPDGPGPHPAVVFMSGCSGFTSSFAPKAYELPAEKLRDMGFVVVWADYLGRRNLKNCTQGIPQVEAGQDAVDAASWLRSQPYVDAKRISAIGWSYGGGSLLAALASHQADELVLTRVIVYYPYCTTFKPWSHRVPVLVLLAGDDNVAAHWRCEAMLRTSSEKGDVKIINYPGAHHSFDFSELPPKFNYPYGTLGYHPQAATSAWEEVKKFLQPTR